jgi:hypothetical protein
LLSGKKERCARQDAETQRNADAEAKEIPVVGSVYKIEEVF